MTTIETIKRINNIRFIKTLTWLVLFSLFFLSYSFALPVEPTNTPTNIFNDIGLIFGLLMILYPAFCLGLIAGKKLQKEVYT